jgi:hypothetical protein
VPNAGIRFRPTPEMFAALNQPVPPEAQNGGGRGGFARGGGQGRNGGTLAANNAAAPAGQPTTTQPVPAAAAPRTGGGRGAGGNGANANADANGADAGGGRGGGGRGFRGGDPAQQLDRFKAMTPDDQQQFIARLKSRGQDTSAFEAAQAAAAPGTPAKAGAKPGTKPAATPTASESLAALLQPKYGTALSGATIDALFAPVPAVESRGRLWLYVDQQIKPVNVRLGITDGTNTELIGSQDVAAGTEVVTSVSGTGAARPAAGGGGAVASPFQQGGRGGGGNRGR